MAKKIFTGKVVSTKMVNTVVVTLDRKVPHPRYGKLIHKTKRFFADLNNIEVKTGDIVEIEEIAPMSKNKMFKVIKVVGKEEEKAPKVK